MKIIKRFQYYGIGLLIGLMLTFVFFQNRGCSWLPENRVKNAILDNVVVFSQSEELTPEQKEDYFLLLNNGDVKFGLSKKDGEPKLYFLKGEDRNGSEIQAQFELRKDGFISLCTPLTNNTVITDGIFSGTASMEHFPLDTALVAFENVAKCQAKYLGISEKQTLEALQKSGKVDYDKSNPQNPEKHIYHLTFTYLDQVYATRANWYKDKIYITYFYDSGSDCK